MDRNMSPGTSSFIQNCIASFHPTQLSKFCAFPPLHDKHFWLALVSFSWETLYAELNQASRVYCISPYLCPDCSETWNHSPHYRWLSPENQKRSDWPRTHGGSVWDSSPLRNLFEYHLRWRAPSLREGGDTRKGEERQESNREGAKSCLATKVHMVKNFLDGRVRRIYQSHSSQHPTSDKPDTQTIPPTPAPTLLKPSLCLPLWKTVGFLENLRGESRRKEKVVKSKMYLDEESQARLGTITNCFPVPWFFSYPARKVTLKNLMIL